MSGEPRVQDISEARGPMRCRIPQRLTSFRTRQTTATNSTQKPNNFESSKQKYEMTSPTTRFSAKNTARPRSGEYSRPKSGNSRNKEDTISMRQGYTPTRSGKPNERAPVTPKDLLVLVQRHPPILRKQIESHNMPNKSARPIIRIPTNQETILKQENEMSDGAATFNEDAESISSRSEKLMQLKITWQEKMLQFERMKNDLKDQQNGVLELYATMRDTREHMSILGEQASLPTVSDLRIMNVTQMTPEQLLHLCAGDDPKKKYRDNKVPFAVDVNKLYDMPCKLVDTCEQTLEKRKEIIDWFESLKSIEKGISIHVLSKKINEFNAENDMLRCTFEQVKVDFQKDLDDVVDLMRKSVNETMALQLRIEELTYEMSELNSQNADLKKQILNTDQVRSHTNKARVEELEKELKDEKIKRAFLRERLSRTEGQVKINIERASQLEATLEQARSQIWSLERTLQQLREQNQILQNEFDKELKKLTESIKEHTVHFEEIAENREKLQTEKEDLEKKITELSSYYNESLKNAKQEIQSKIEKLKETEEKYEKEIEERKKLEEELEALNNNLHDAESRHNDALKLISEKSNQLNEAVLAQKELIDARRELEDAIKEINNNRAQLKKQSDQLDEVECNFKQAIDLEKSLKREIRIKEEYINDLEKKQANMEQQFKENENKMESYVEQLSSLKTHIKQLQEDFGEFENLNELHDMVNQQRANLLEVTRQNGELAKTLQKKNEELEGLRLNLSEHEQLLVERQEIINILSEKEEEHTNIIKILRNNLELRSQADNELSQQILEKNGEIEALIVNIETKKQQISNLEKIILTLEDQTRKASVHKKKDQEHIKALQKKINEYEAFHVEATHNIEAPAETLDSLIKILENELGASADHQMKSKVQGYLAKKFSPEKVECHEDENNYSATPCHFEPDAFPTKTAMGNFVKKSYLPNREEQYMGDNLDRKKAITNMDTKKRALSHVPESGINLNARPQQHSPSIKENLAHLRRMSPTSPPKSPVYSRNLQFLNPEQLRDDKQNKMFKWAGHRL